MSRSTSPTGQRFTVDWPVISEHAAERWHQRRSEPADGQTVGPQVAWVDAQVVPAASYLFDCDSARYHEATDTVFLRKDTTIVTVLDASSGAAPMKLDQVGIRGEQA